MITSLIILLGLKRAFLLRTLQALQIKLVLYFNYF